MYVTCHSKERHAHQTGKYFSTVYWDSQIVFVESVSQDEIDSWREDHMPLVKWIEGDDPSVMYEEWLYVRSGPVAWDCENVVEY